METPAPNFRFGPYESRLRTRELYKHGSKLKVRPQPLQVLNLLLSHAGDVVTREELRQQLWSSETFVDFEHSLNTSVKEIRGVLGDSAAEPRFIQTLPKLGYRFIAAVEVIEPRVNSIPSHVPADAASSDSADIPDFATPSRTPARSAPRRWPAALAISLVLIATLGTGAYVRWRHFRARPQAASGGRAMVAVLPFENLTGDATQEYFSDGLTEEMIAQLGRTDPQHLGVIARTSVMHYKNTQEPLDQIGRELGVGYVLEGSVRRDANKVRITAQLIQMKDQTHILSRQYDRDLSNLLSLQDEIAQEITGEILLALGERPNRTGHALASSPGISPQSYEAYDLYLQGRYFWNKRTSQGFQQAVQCFEQSVAKDPTYARSYAGLADTYALMSAYDVAPPSELIPKARAAALKALELDEQLAEAHVSLALIAQNYDWDWQTSEKEYRRAIALDPNYATAHHWYAEHLALLGRFEEAFLEMQRARQLDPLSLIIQTDNAAILYFSRQYDPAIVQFRAVLEMEPNFPRANMLAYAYVQEGRFADALADVENWSRVDNSYWPWAVGAYVYGRAGQPAQARRALEKLQLLNRRQIDPFVFVSPYIGLGDKDRALAWLDKAVAGHSPGLTALKVDPIYDPLRNDPRFQEFLRRVGLAQ
jgi:TolB-like protein/DNA-binding winged helix-turn-helix (wHTH) protein/Tfp pilus assembly protein PilF